MPRIQWTNLPAELRSHLFDRLVEREISIEDLYKLKLWREWEPRLQKVFGTKILVPSKFAARDAFPRHFFYEGKSPKVRHCLELPKLREALPLKAR
jgi:hypothetical protein